MSRFAGGAPVKRLQRGSITVISLLFISLILILGGSIVTYVVREYENTYQARDLTRALALAEAGIDYAVYQLRQDKNYVGPTTKYFGSDYFTVRVTQRISDTEVVVESQGTIVTTDVTRRIRARIKRNPFGFSNAAMAAEGDIEIGNLQTQTVDDSENPVATPQAHVWANGNATVNRPTIHGRLAAAGTVTTGMGWINVNDPDYPQGQSGAPRIEMPTLNLVNLWRSEWLANSNSWPRYTLASPPPGMIRSGNVLKTNLRRVEISAPCIIDASVEVSVNTELVFTGSGVVWITGNLIMKSNSELESSALVVLDGVFDQASNSEYEVSSFSVNALVSFYQGTGAAIRLASNTTQRTGIMYAVYRDIELSMASANVTGAFWAGYAGMTSPKASIRQTSNAASGIIRFPYSSLMNTGAFLKEFTVTGWEEL